jgi:sugar-specific transcriptional regulator TrmB
MPEYLSLLRSIGLNESEAQVYLTNLEIGPAPAQLLVDKSGFSRPATYLAIDQLVQKGLLTSSLKGKRNVYRAESPERLLRYARSYAQKIDAKVQDIADVLDDLKMMQRGERPVVKFYEGSEGLKRILEDLVESEPESIEEIANLDAVREIFSTSELRNAQNILDRRKTKGRSLFMGEVHEKRSRADIRMIPKNVFPFYGDLLIYGDKVAMVSFKDRIIGVVVESKVLADTHRALFELAWRGAERL